MKKELILGSNIIEMVEEIKDMIQCCDNCGNVTSDLTEVNNGDMVCSDCLDNYCYCDECGDVFPEDEMTSWGNECFCDDCIDEVTSVCECCGHRFATDDIYYCECVGEYRCENCFVEDESLSLDGDIYNYVFLNGSDNVYNASVRYYGLEIETDNFDDFQEANDMADFNTKSNLRLSDNERLFYSKYDGSLSDSGIEFVSQPATKEVFESFDFNRWFTRLHQCGANTEVLDGVGFHIHVNNDSLGVDESQREFTKAKLLLMIPALESYLIQVSRRIDSLRWCKPNTKLDIDYSNTRELNIWRLSQAYRYRDTDRYQMLNLNNSATIEFRLFANATSREDVLCAMEICNTLCDYAMTHTLHQCMTVNPFRLHRDNKPSEMLIEYYGEQGVIWLK